MVGKYKVITLCGSTRFKDAFMQAQKRLTLEENIVISVGLFGHSGDKEVWENMDEGTLTKTKEMLDDMHKRKIDMSDEIYVINVGGYIGSSTKSEIEYALLTGKKVRYIEEQAAAEGQLLQAFDFRTILPEETDQAIAIEQACFPPDEALSPESVADHIQKAADLFLAAVDKDTGHIAGFVNGLASNENKFRDEFLTDAGLHDPQGRNIMLTGLEVLPEYRGQGLARELMIRFLRREHEKRTESGLAILTCRKEKVKMYQKMGFTDRGISDSAWGGVEWHEMTCPI